MMADRDYTAVVADDEEAQGQLLAASGEASVEAAAADDDDDDDDDNDEVDAPTWFELPAFRVLEQKWFYCPCYVLLTLSPILTAAGSALELYLHCTTESFSIEVLLALGVFAFSVVWVVLFHALRKVVRGAHLNETQLLAADEQLEEQEKMAAHNHYLSEPKVQALMLKKLIRQHSVDLQTSVEAGAQPGGEAEEAAAAAAAAAAAKEEEEEGSPLSDQEQEPGPADALRVRTQSRGSMVCDRVREHTKSQIIPMNRKLKVAGIAVTAAGRLSDEMLQARLEEAVHDVNMAAVEYAYGRQYQSRVSGRKLKAATVRKQAGERDKTGAFSHQISNETHGPFTRLAFDGGHGVLERVRVNPRFKDRLGRWLWGMVLFGCMFLFMFLWLGWGIIIMIRTDFVFDKNFNGSAQTHSSLSLHYLPAWLPQPRFADATAIPSD